MTDFEIPLFDIYEFFGTLLNANLTDPKASTREGKWIFPDFPIANSNLPQITIKYEDLLYENDSAGDYFKEELDGATYKKYYYRMATTTVHVYVLTGKTQEWVVSVNSINRKFTNKLFNTYLTNQAKDVLLKNRPSVLTTFDEFNIEDIEFAFEANKYTWSSHIKCPLKFKDIWCDEYESGELIASYSMNTTVET